MSHADYRRRRSRQQASERAAAIIEISPEADEDCCGQLLDDEYCPSLRSEDVVQPNGMRSCPACGAVRDPEKRDVDYDVGPASNATPWHEPVRLASMLSEASRQSDKMQLLRTFHYMEKLPELMKRAPGLVAMSRFPVSARAFLSPSLSTPPPPSPSPLPTVDPPQQQIVTTDSDETRKRLAAEERETTSIPPVKKARKKSPSAKSKKQATAATTKKAKAVKTTKQRPKNQKSKQCAEDDQGGEPPLKENHAEMQLAEIRNVENSTIPPECFAETTALLTKQEGGHGIKCKDSWAVLCINMLLLLCWKSGIPFEWQDFQQITRKMDVVTKMKPKRCCSLWNKAVEMINVDFTPALCKTLCGNSFAMVCQNEKFFVRPKSAWMIEQAATKYFNALCKQTHYFEDGINCARGKNAAGDEDVSNSKKPVRNQRRMPRLWVQAVMLCFQYVFEIDDKHCALRWDLLVKHYNFRNSTVSPHRRMVQETYPKFWEWVVEEKSRVRAGGGSCWSACDSRWESYNKKERKNKNKSRASHKKSPPLPMSAIVSAETVKTVESVN